MKSPWSIVGITISVLTSGCVSSKPYWANPSLDSSKGNQQITIPHSADHRFHKNLRIVEFDDQGMNWNPDQKLEAAKHFSNLRKPFLVTFIHGWHNNAHPDNSDLRTFNELLLRMENSAAIRNAGYSVCGLYVGWRGLTHDKRYDLLTWVPRHTSFYARKAATDRIARVPLAATLLGLSKEVRRKGGRSVMIGHSFGARILERVVSSALVSQVAGLGTTSVETPADLVLLLNPASEAQFALESKSLLRDWKPAVPAIVSITSESDSATRYAWPTAIFLDSWRRGGYRNEGTRYKQRDFFTTTTGHSNYLIDKEVVATGDSVYSSANVFDWNLTTNEVRREGLFLARTKQGIRTYQIRDRHQVDPLLRSQAYWVVRVPDEIISGHGGIFSNSAIDLLGAIYNITQIRSSFAMSKARVTAGLKVE